MAPKQKATGEPPSRLRYSQLLTDSSDFQASFADEDFSLSAEEGLVTRVGAVARAADADSYTSEVETSQELNTRSRRRVKAARHVAVPAPAGSGLVRRQGRVSNVEAEEHSLGSQGTVSERSRGSLLRAFRFQSPLLPFIYGQAKVLFFIFATICALGLIFTSKFEPPFETERVPASLSALTDLTAAHSGMEHLLSASISAVPLSLDMARSEPAVRDLRARVRHSNLHGRDSLERELGLFVEDSEAVSDELAEFNARVRAAVDKLAGVAEVTLGVLEVAVGNFDKRKRPLTATGTPSYCATVLQVVRAVVPSASFVQSGGLETALTQFCTHASQLFMGSGGGQALSPATASQVSTHVNLHLSKLDQNLRTLTITSTALLGHLASLDARLDVIADLSSREGATVGGQRDRVLGTLWTVLGGNQGIQAKLKGDLLLLDQVAAQQRKAVALVVGVKRQLRSVRSQLKVLRDDTAEPAFMTHSGDGTWDQTLLLAQARAMQRAVESLKSARKQDRAMISEGFRKVAHLTAHSEL